MKFDRNFVPQELQTSTYFFPQICLSASLSMEDVKCAILTFVKLPKIRLFMSLYYVSHYKSNNTNQRHISLTVTYHCNCELSKDI